MLDAAKNQSADICKMPPPTAEDDDDGADSAACSSIAQFRGIWTLIRWGLSWDQPVKHYTHLTIAVSFTFFYHNTCENDSPCVACCPLARTLAHTAFAVDARLFRWRPWWVAVSALQTPRRLTVAIVVISLNYSWQITRRRRADFIFVRNSIICMFVASYRSGSVSRCSRCPLILSELSMFGFWQPFFAFSSTVATQKRIP